MTRKEGCPECGNIKLSQEEYKNLMDELSILRERLYDAEQWCNALESAGVDSWDGVGYAKELLEEWQND